MHVAIVSNNPETLDALSEYLGNAGVACHTARAVHDLNMTTPKSVCSAVIFPDDFADLDVLGLLQKFQKQRPNLLAVLVTREPNRYRSVAAVEGTPRAPVVLPRPSFGWEILDAIRAHAEMGSP